MFGVQYMILLCAPCGSCAIVDLKAAWINRRHSVVFKTGNAIDAISKNDTANCPNKQGELLKSIKRRISSLGHSADIYGVILYSQGRQKHSKSGGTRI